MIKNGWNVDIEYSNTKDWSQDYLVNCGTQTFYGYHGDQKVGTVSATFQGSGNATLIFGNCYKEGFVEVLLNEEHLKQANPDLPLRSCEEVLCKYSVVMSLDC